MTVYKNRFVSFKLIFLILIIVSMTIPIVYWAHSIHQPMRQLDKKERNDLNRSNPPKDKFTRCLFDAHIALSNMSLRWFLAFGTAIMFYRSNNFISDDIDIGIFLDDLKKLKIDEKKFVSVLVNQGFKLYTRYGTMEHGQGWTLLCPKSRVHFGVFVFYPADRKQNETFTWWTASYNGPCKKMRYQKCRWSFSEFHPKPFQIYQKEFYVAPESFLIDTYGPHWRIPKNYTYSQSLNFCYNLIQEY